MFISKTTHTSSHQRIRSDHSGWGSMDKAKREALENVLAFVNASSTTNTHRSALNDLLTLVSVVGSGRGKTKYPIQQLDKTEHLANILTLQLGCSEHQARCLADAMLVLTTHRHETFDLFRQYFGHSTDTQSVEKVRASIKAKISSAAEKTHGVTLTHDAVERYVKTGQTDLKTQDRIFSLCDTPFTRQVRVEWCQKVAPTLDWGTRLGEEAYCKTFAAAVRRNLQAKVLQSTPAQTSLELGIQITSVAQHRARQKKMGALRALLSPFFRNYTQMQTGLTNLSLSSYELSQLAESHLFAAKKGCEAAAVQEIYDAFVNAQTEALAAKKYAVSLVKKSEYRVVITPPSNLPEKDQFKVMILQRPGSQSPGVLVRFTSSDAAVVDATLYHFVRNADGTIVYQDNLLLLDEEKTQRLASELNQYEFEETISRAKETKNGNTFMQALEDAAVKAAARFSIQLPQAAQHSALLLVPAPATLTLAPKPVASQLDLGDANLRPRPLSPQEPGAKTRGGECSPQHGSRASTPGPSTACSIGALTPEWPPQQQHPARTPEESPRSSISCQRAPVQRVLQFQASIAESRV